MNDDQNKKPLPKAVREFFSKCGKKGGKLASREDKSRAGKLGYAAMIAKVTKEAKEETPKPEQQEQESTQTPTETQQ